MEDVRFCVAGLGNIGRTHVETLAGGTVERGRLSAVVTSADASLPSDVARYASLEEALAADAADAVIVATPTMTHPALGRQVLDAGRHLVMEKPLAMSVRDARQLVASVPEGVIAGAMLNQRYHPAYREIKNLITHGELGRIVRFNWIMTAWYRPDVYFLVSRWRGTWPGEGGGALLNQCIHNLDILYWLFGMPETVLADVSFGKFHDIEVEDEVNAILTYADGTTGVVVASTGEAPGINRLDIVGERGSLSYDGHALTLAQTDESVAEHCATTREMFGMPNFHRSDVTLAPDLNQHACVLQDVVNAVLDDVPLATPLQEGVGSIELANAMLMSAWEDRRVRLPLDAAAYQAGLDARVVGAELRDPANIDAHIDMDASYR